MSRNFEFWLKQLRKNIINQDYYIDFAKNQNFIQNKLDYFKTEIILLNQLLTSDNKEKLFLEILKQNRNILAVISFIYSLRDNVAYLEIPNNGIKKLDFDTFTNNDEDYLYFLKLSGFFTFIELVKLTSFYDVIIGVGFGIDTNARKNRVGKAMEWIIYQHLIKADFNVAKQCSLSTIEKALGYKFSNDLSKSIKKFDFVISTGNSYYGIETNFYQSSGSKLNEIARSYRTIYNETKNIPNFKFIWITDGCGWLHNKTVLKETFDVFDNIYNLKELEDGVLNKIIK